VIVSDDEVASALREARAAARVFRLPFRRERWRGTIGNWSGAGVGTSIDFHDHRPYSPGDDPRYIDWLAYARSDAYVMKLYREEVAPAVDLVLDTSSSMGMEPAKRLCSLALFYFIVEAALARGRVSGRGFSARTARSALIWMTRTGFIEALSSIAEMSSTCPRSDEWLIVPVRCGFLSAMACFARSPTGF
jgi:uncharacterized protein (DUF58 family)